MDGIHDLGGKAGFGKVEAEEDEPYFHGLGIQSIFDGLNLRQHGSVSSCS